MKNSINFTVYSGESHEYFDLERDYMYTSLQLKNFRGYENFQTNLNRITLIGGENNKGKTSILEALYMLNGYTSHDIFSRIANFRSGNSSYYNHGITTDVLFEPIFHNMNLDNTIEINTDKVKFSIGKSVRIPISSNRNYNSMNPMGSIDSFENLFCKVEKDDQVFDGDYILVDDKYGQRLVLKGPDDESPIPLSQVSFFSSRSGLYTGEIAESLGKIELKNQKQRMIQVLQILDKDITDVLTVFVKGSPQVYIVKENNKLPLNIMGDGIKKIIDIAITIVTKPNSLVLIDEVENGIHRSLLGEFWRVLATLSKEENVQVIVTTHSNEYIEDAKNGVAQAGLAEEFTYIKL